MPGLSLQRPTAPNVVASLKQGDLDEFDAGTRPKSQSSRSSASPRPLTSRASTTKLKVTFMLTNINSMNEISETDKRILAARDKIG